MWLWHGVGGWPRNHERVCGAQRRPTELRDPVYVSISVPVLGVRYLVCMYLILFVFVFEFVSGGTWLAALGS